MTCMFYFLILPLLVRGQISFWNKNHLTYSVENDFHRIELIKNAINEMDIQTLEIDYVNPGQGDIKIYFRDNMNPRILGTAYPPEGGMILINRPAVQEIYANMSVIIQHEFAHALGLDHNDNYNSAMLPDYINGSSFLNTDKNNLNELYKCRYDGVTLLNDKTYIKFKGRHYERMYLNETSIFKSKLWHPSIFKVNAMYKNNTYFIIANNFQYFEYNHSMELIKEGYISDLFPNIENGVISAILTLNNGSIICFLQNRDILYDGVKIDPTFYIPPKDFVQGAFSTFNRIYLIVKDYIYTYDKDFMFLEQNRLCDHPKFRKIHCCNGYSNM